MSLHYITNVNFSNVMQNLTVTMTPYIQNITKAIQLLSQDAINQYLASSRAKIEHLSSGMTAKPSIEVELGNTNNEIRALEREIRKLGKKSSSLDLSSEDIESLKSLPNALDQISSYYNDRSRVNPQEDIDLDIIAGLAEILTFVPVVNSVFAALRLVIKGIKKIVHMKEEVKVISETFCMIARLSNNIGNRLQQCQKENISLTKNEIDGIWTYVRVINDGLRHVKGAIEKRDLSIMEKLFGLPGRIEALQSWMSVAKQLAEDETLLHINMIAYRTKFMIELQKQNFAIIKGMQVLQLSLTAAILYSIYDIRRIMLLPWSFPTGIRFLKDQSLILFRRAIVLADSPQNDVLPW